jgi:hypothetical protein
VIARIATLFEGLRGRGVGGIYAPTAVATTRYRPLIGGNVTRWRYVNRPTVVYPSTVAYYPAW